VDIGGVVIMTKKKLEEFLEMLAENDFAVGDSFWLEGTGFRFQFEVTSHKLIR
jgi:hypothetical protein